MIVVGLDIAGAYLAEHAGEKGIASARTSYDAWLRIARSAAWTTPIGPKRSHPKASVLRFGRVVFNIKGNDFRLVAQINYAAGTVEIRFFGTHDEYDEINAETV